MTLQNPARSQFNIPIKLSLLQNDPDLTSRNVRYSKYFFTENRVYTYILIFIYFKHSLEIKRANWRKKNLYLYKVFVPKYFKTKIQNVFP